MKGFWNYAQLIGQTASEESTIADVIRYLMTPDFGFHHLSVELSSITK